MKNRDAACSLLALALGDLVVKVVLALVLLSQEPVFLRMSYHTEQSMIDRGACPI